MTPPSSLCSWYVSNENDLSTRFTSILKVSPFAKSLANETQSCFISSRFCVVLNTGLIDFMPNIFVKRFMTSFTFASSKSEINMRSLSHLTRVPSNERNDWITFSFNTFVNLFLFVPFNVSSPYLTKIWSYFIYFNNSFIWA